MQMLSNPARVAADPLFGSAHIFEVVLSGKAVADYVLHSACGIRTGNTGCADFTLRATYDATLMHSFPPFHYVALKDPILSIGGMKHFKVTAKTMYVAVRSSFAYLEYADVDLMRIALSINTFFLDHALGPLPGTVEVQPHVVLEGSYHGERAEFSLAAVQNQSFSAFSRPTGVPSRNASDESVERTLRRSPQSCRVAVIVALTANGFLAGRVSLRDPAGDPFPHEPLRYGTVPQLITNPTRIEAAGNKPKLIDEFIGAVNTGDTRISVARMRSPGGWVEPCQRPQFDEFTVVLSGTLRVEHEGGALDVHAGQAVHTRPGEWIRYSTPGADGAEYIAVCLPAFSPATVNRDE